MAPQWSEFLRRLLRPGGGEPAAREESGTPVEYKGYVIRPLARRKGSEWLTTGVITKTVADETREHRFVRVDTHSSRDAAEAFTVTKAKQLIDEQGERLFRDD